MNETNQKSSSAYDSRHLAWRLVTEILKQKQPLDQVLPSLVKTTDFVPADRAFAQRLATNYFRYRQGLAKIYENYVTRPLPPRYFGVQIILEMALLQILVLKLADHAVVDSAVWLTRKIGAPRHAGLVNAVMRGFLREKNKWQKEDLFAPALPGWFHKMIQKNYGEDTAKAIDNIYRQDPPLDFTMKESVSWEGVAFDDLPLGDGAQPMRRIRGEWPSLTKLPGFDDGAWWVQDWAASLPAQLGRRLSGAKPGDWALDCCAAPGGKTMQLLAEGMKVTALDISSSRLDVMQENLTRMQFDAELVAADFCAFQSGQEDKDYKLILLDAPCSASGTIRRHPELPWIKDEKNIAALTALQEKMLRHAFQMTKPKTILLYAVCSLDPREGKDQIEKILRDEPDAQLQPIRDQDLPPILLPCLTREGYVQTLPHHLAEKGGMDGFFIAALTRRG